MKFNQRYFLCWKAIKVHGGTVPAGRQEIVKDEWHSLVNRQGLANEQAKMMNNIYGDGTHWIETDE